MYMYQSFLIKNPYSAYALTKAEKQNSFLLPALKYFAHVLKNYTT